MPSRLLFLIWQNLRRNMRHNILSSIGIIVGIAAFAFFLALDAGVRRVVLGEIFPVDRLEVVAPKSSLFGSGRFIDDAVLARLRQPVDSTVPAPAAVFGRMRLGFPARGWGGARILKRGRDIPFELTGFCDGVDDQVIAPEIKPPFTFRDHLADDQPPPCAPGNRCPEGRYCAWDVNRCHKPVPAVISRHLIELYNSSIAASNPDLPKIPDFLTSIFAGKTFTVELGRSYFGTVVRQGGQPIQRKFQLVGVSDKAIPLGLSVPIGYVKRWNQRYKGGASAKTYSSAVLLTRSKADITPIAAYIKSIGFDVKQGAGKTIGLFITLASFLLTLVSVIIVFIAAINIAHTFLMLVSERRWEIGLLRAVGASRAHVRRTVLGEAAIIGAVSGTVGLSLAWVAALVCDHFSATRLPDFPFKPESYFVFSPTLIALSMGFAIGCCLLGALLPAQRAAALSPAQALGSR
ncbi:MAG: ABC transporter permease [Deltaproteobacteria bacterium]|nr:ABC transporter permease [Deltaproteobacteria bacterium]